jgi:hypothetical protein
METARQLQQAFGREPPWINLSPSPLAVSAAQSAMKALCLGSKYMHWSIVVALVAFKISASTMHHTLAILFHVTHIFLELLVW